MALPLGANSSAASSPVNATPVSPNSTANSGLDSKQNGANGQHDLSQTGSNSNQGTAAGNAAMQNVIDAAKAISQSMKMTV